MRLRGLLLAATASVTVAFLAAASHPARAQAAPAALAGQVSSAEEGPMEGVLVSAKKIGSTITTTVVTDKDGHYSFDASRLEPGKYFIEIRATGYDLDGDGAAEVTAHKTATSNLTLHKTGNLAHQLTNAEWLASIPGTDQQKSTLLNCVGCHTLERPISSKHTADEWVPTLKRMIAYAQVSTPLKPQKRAGPAENVPTEEQIRHQAEYLASINLSSSSTWPYPLKVMPRVGGKLTKVVITEYDLPRPTVEPHDVMLDAKGTVWYSDFGEMFFGRLDPKTGRVTEYPVPLLKKGSPVGMLDLEADKQGDFWLGMMFQSGIAKFDTKTDKFTIWQLPKEADDNVGQLNMVTLRYDVDGKVWTNNVGHKDIWRIDIASKKFEHFTPYDQIPPGSPLANKPHAIYGLAADSKDNLYFTDFAGLSIGRIDAKTGKASFYQTPSADSRPRRGRMDAEDRYWFAEYGANRVAMLDTKTGAIQEWAAPTPWSAPYDVTWDKSGMLWTAGMTTDRVLKIDPETGQAIEYPMPKDTNIRRVFVEETGPRPVFWAGSNHGAAVVRVEPME